MGNCVGSGMRPEVAIKKIIGSKLKDQDCTVSWPHSQKKQIRGDKEEKKPRTVPLQTGLSGGRPAYCRVKVIISANKLSEMLADGDTRKDALLSFVLEKVQRDGYSCNRGVKVGKSAARKRRAGWTPGLEDIPEESSSTY